MSVLRRQKVSAQLAYKFNRVSYGCRVQPSVRIISMPDSEPKTQEVLTKASITFLEELHSTRFATSAVVDGLASQLIARQAEVAVCADAFLTIRDAIGWNRTDNEEAWNTIEEPAKTVQDTSLTAGKKEDHLQNRDLQRKQRALAVLMAMYFVERVTHYGWDT